MGRLMALLADRLCPGNAVADHMLNWPGDPNPSADSVPLRLAGALHALKLDGLALTDVYPPETPSDDALWDAIDAAFRAHPDRLLDWLTRAPQTNEVRRSAVILAALAEVARRYPDRDVALYELGASGGLNLLADRYQLALSTMTLGPVDAKVILRPDWSGPLPHPTLPNVTGRRGVDLAPLDPMHAADRLRFLAYLWPDQPDRQDLTERALAEAQNTPVALETGDAGAWLDDVLNTALDTALPVVLHTVAWQYFPQSTKDRALETLARTETPVVQIGMETDGTAPGAAITLTEWPAGEATPLGRADFHGRWINWY